MRFNEGLQVRLQEKYRRLYKTSYDSYGFQAKYFVDWIETQPALTSILGTVDRSTPEVDAAQWYEQHKGRDGRGLAYPDSEAGFAKIAWWLVQETARAGAQGFRIPMDLTYVRNMDDAIRDFTSAVVEPLIEYLQERLAAETDVLYTLERYRRRVQWFEHERLWEAYNEGSVRGEAILDRDLRKFLFDQGIDYPYSQPASASGKADVVANIETDEDPLVCEVKLFNNDSYGAAYLAKGLNQAVRYADDYGKNEAYLVIFNLSDRRLELPTDDSDSGWPSRLHTAGITAFLIDVQVAPLPSASVQKPQQPVVLSRVQLLP
ncbi:hypothetical protein [Euzebya rosea]|uniref:hypothetical protein n=1 Tax=Euzebya rosea TaxID=2052804 RepID=UPI000D3ED4CE|nr:hypothetical protein [Euzebya rosea]